MRSIESMVEEGQLDVVSDLLDMEDIDDDELRFLRRDPQFKQAAQKAARKALCIWRKKVRIIAAHVKQCPACGTLFFGRSLEHAEEEIKTWGVRGRKNVVNFVCQETNQPLASSHAKKE